MIYGDQSHLIQHIKTSNIDLNQLTNTIDENGNTIPLDLTTWDDRQPFSSTLAIMKFVLFSLIGMIVFVTGLGILNTMLMSVMERTQEIGILRALGMPKGKIAWMILLEGSLISLGGGCLGAGLGAVISLNMASVGIDLGTAAAALPDSLPINTTIFPNYHSSMSIGAIGLSLGMACIGSFIPIIIATKKHPVQAMAKNRP